MDGFRRMLLVGRQHSADHIPVSALQLDEDRGKIYFIGNEVSDRAVAVPVEGFR